MTTNKKKIFVTESMSQQGRELLHARDDIELIEFLASYYMAPLAEAYRTVIPAVARVDSTPSRPERSIFG